MGNMNKVDEALERVKKGNPPYSPTTLLLANEVLALRAELGPCTCGSGEEPDCRKHPDRKELHELQLERDALLKEIAWQTAVNKELMKSQESLARDLIKCRESKR